ncbi:MlaD family protein [Flavihumibacter sp. CACIAM 22H1]|uniref:MlaD family protein n=1 Tax=Flavihumibacter sp. CACIAM 22H1 TaxID=1812911 RepID=UPI0007A7D15E|nr:MlaD family protein [Flavihumibacter sp. CACIAM 22H1]KYP14026.1 MAG: hypothetical protein A1D16_04135 [Flavihumibacter sp. CACIAM 22H1]
MKIPNETRIGILAIVSIVLLILGFNFLKGKSFFDKNDHIYAVFPKVTGLANSSPVSLNGLQIGMVSEIKEKSPNIEDGIVVTINLARHINIPKNSITYISADLLGSSSLVIEPGNSGEFLADGDTILSKTKAGLLDEVKGSLNPALNSLDATLVSLDSLIQVVGTYFDPATKDNFHVIIANLSKASASLNNLIASQNSALNKSMQHLESVTGNLAANNETITHTLGNLEKTTEQLAAADIKGTVASLQNAVSNLNGVVAKANSKEGSIGLLLNDKKLYQNLENTSRSLNILLDDFRTHPKRYINVSVFGRKDKSKPLQAPLNDSTQTTPQSQ